MTIAEPLTTPDIRKNGTRCNGNCEWCDCRYPDLDDEE
jgi:hypothetical protein